MNLLQILVTLFSLFAISRSFLLMKHGDSSVREFLMWSAVWVGATIIVYIPWITEFPAKLLGIGRGIDVFVYLGMVFLFYSTYRIYAKIENLEQEITKIVREISKKK